MRQWLTTWILWPTSLNWSALRGRGDIWLCNTFYPEAIGGIGFCP
jgi:hypothetical protein